MKTPACTVRERRYQSSADCEAPFVNSVRWRVSRLGFLCGLAILAAAPARAVETAAVPDAAAIAPAVTVVPAESREIVERAVVTGTLVPARRDPGLPRDRGPAHHRLAGRGGRPRRQGSGAGEALAGDDRHAGGLERGGDRPRRGRDRAGPEPDRPGGGRQRRGQAVAGTRPGPGQDRQRHRGVLEQRVSAAQGAEGRLAAAKGGLQSAQADLATARGLRVRDRPASAPAPTSARPEAGIVNRRTARVGATATAVGRAAVPPDRPGRDRARGRGARDARWRASRSATRPASTSTTGASIARQGPPGLPGGRPGDPARQGPHPARRRSGPAHRRLRPRQRRGGAPHRHCGAGLQPALRGRRPRQRAGGEGRPRRGAEGGDGPLRGGLHRDPHAASPPARASWPAPAASCATATGCARCRSAADDAPPDGRRGPAVASRTPCASTSPPGRSASRSPRSCCSWS